MNLNQDFENNPDYVCDNCENTNIVIKEEDFFYNLKVRYDAIKVHSLNLLCRG